MWDLMDTFSKTNYIIRYEEYLKVLENLEYKEIVLEEQDFIKDSGLTVGQYVSNNGGKILSMVRFAVGEGIEKREENFAEEVASQIKNA